MIKLIILACLLLGFYNYSMAYPTKTKLATFSIEANPFPTDYGNRFANYHVNLDLVDFRQVSNGAAVQITIDYLSGMEIKETRFEQKSNGGIYYVTDLVTPMYRATVADQMGRILLQEVYGGFDKSIDFGRDLSLPESHLASKWLKEKDKHLQRVEFQSLDFADFQIELAEALANRPTVPKLEAEKKKEEDKITNKNKETPKVQEVIVEKQAAVRSREKAVPPTAKTTEEKFVDDPFGTLEVESDETNLVPTNVEQKLPRRKRYFGSKNLLKLNLPNLLFNNVTLNYERMVNKQHTLSFHLGYLRPQEPFFALHNALKLEDDLDPGRLSGFTATAEYRFYQNEKGAGRGLYVAPYLRYANYDLAVNTIIVGNYANTNTSVSTVGIGGQLGMQWLIGEQVVVDLGILGLALQSYTLTSSFKTIDEPIDFDEIRDRIQQEVQGYPFIRDLSFSETNESLSLKMPFLFGGARAYLSVGFKF